MLEVRVEQSEEQRAAPPPGLAERETAMGKPDLETARILMAAGGTGGHIFPALAVAEELRRRAEGEVLVLRPGLELAEEFTRRAARHELRATRPQAGIRARPAIEFLGTHRGLESRVIPRAGFALRTVRSAGLKGIGGWKRLLNLMVLPQSLLETALVLREFRPDVVVGIGGYLAGPVMLEAAMKDVPTLLIEPNALPGFTNRVLAPLVRVAAVGFEEAARFYGSKARLTGHAVRKAFHGVPAKVHQPPLTLLIVGGSQGAKALNECATKALPLVAAAIKDLKVIHQTGERDYNVVCEAYRSRGIPVEVTPFVEDMPQAFARADLVVSRAGASTVAELAAAGKASLLVPFPGAADQHQLANARALERGNAARVVEQRAMTPQRLAEEIEDLLLAPERLEQMERAARSMARPDSTERIADLIEGLIR